MDTSRIAQEAGNALPPVTPPVLPKRKWRKKLLVVIVILLILGAIAYAAKMLVR